MEEPPRHTTLTDYVVVDVETTGLCPMHNAPTEIGAVRFSTTSTSANWTQHAVTFSTLVRPPHPIPKIATTVTGITDQMVADAPDPKNALADFWDFASGAILVAHNAAFDAAFLHHHTITAKLPWPNAAWIDTLWWARQAWPRPVVANHRLGTLAKYISAPTSPTHRALADAWTTAHLLHALRQATGWPPIGGYCPPQAP